MRRLSLLVLVGVSWLATPALASKSEVSSVPLWSALDGNVICGIAIHPPNTPPMQILCSARQVPPPKGRGVGDPGFVFLSSVGRPSPARLGQDSFVASNQVALSSGERWGGGPIDVLCRINHSAVRCINRSHHGFTISRRSYHSF